MLKWKQLTIGESRKTGLSKLFLFFNSNVDAIT